MFLKIEEILHKIPVVSGIVDAMYTYFRKNILFTNLIHVILGIGIGLVISNYFFMIGLIFIGIGSLGHILAYIKGKTI